jgi:mevalonate pyrophosphate decarboxylase
MESVRVWRRAGLPVCYTIDAGANVHVITLKEKMKDIKKLLASLDGVQNVITATVGGAARLI